MKIRDISQQTMKLIERNVEMVSKHDMLMIIISSIDEPNFTSRMTMFRFARGWEMLLYMVVVRVFFVKATALHVSPGSCFGVWRSHIKGGDSVELRFLN